MRLKIERKNMARFASLSALGAGAMVLTTGTANASIVHVVEDQTISFGGIGTSVLLPGGAGFVIFAGSQPHSSHFRFLSTIQGGSNRLVTESGTRRTVHRTVFLEAVSNLAFGSRRFSGPTWRRGQAWGSVNRTTDNILAARRYSRVTTVRYFPNIFGGTPPPTFRTAHSSQFAPFAGSYFLFRFIDNGTPLYGWGSLYGFIGSTGPVAMLLDYAYDTTGAYLPAGVTGAPVSEPAETIPLGLSALVLGAAGVRRWRASKAA